MRVRGVLKTAIVLLLALGAVATVEFAPELYSFAWHKLHRGVAHFKSEALTAYEMRVPSTFSAFRLDDCSVSVSKQTGPIRSRLGWQGASKMSFSACRIYTTAKEIEANAPKLRDELGILTIPRESVAIAGQELQCYERLGNQEIVQGTQVSAVDCVPLSSDGELSASFVGSADHLPAFYSLLRTVKRPDVD
jgi:hypothetical protein